MKKLFAGIMASVMLAGALGGCSSAPAASSAAASSKAEGASSAVAASSAAESKPAELTTVTVGYMPNYGSLCSVIAGKELGYFKDQGIDIKLVEFADGPTIIAAMESGSVDIGYIGPGAHKLCIEGRALIFSISHTGNGDLVIGNKEKGINTIQDLKGKTVAITSATSSQTCLENALTAAGMKKEDVKIIDMDASAIVTAMLSGGIDACATWAPGTDKIKEVLGGNAIVLNDEPNKVPDLASWIVNKDYYDSAEHKDIVLRFTKALFKAMDYRAKEENYQQVSEWVAKQVAQDVNAVLLQAKASGWMSAESAIEMMNDGSMKAAYEGQQKRFREAGTITVSDVPVEDYVLFQNMLDAAADYNK